MTIKALNELTGAINKYPLDSTVLFKNRAIGTVNGYKRGTGGSIEIIFKHYKHLALGKESMFSLKSRNYSNRVS